MRHFVLLCLALAVAARANEELPQEPLEVVDRLPAAAEPKSEDLPSTPVIRPLIVGGERVSTNRFEYTAALMTYSTAVCTSVLIHPQVLLTAGHCTKAGRLVGAKVSAKNWAIDDIQGRKYYPEKTRKVILHPGYDRVNEAQDRFGRDEVRDIAIVVLREPVPKAVTPIKLPKSNTKIPKNLVVAGYGLRKEEDPLEAGLNTYTKLRAAKVTYFPNPLCTALFKKNAPEVKLAGLNADIICAGSLSGKTDACEGDSGGPLLIPGKSPKDDVLVGLVSFGFGCGRPGVPGGYTNVKTFLPWINAELKKLKKEGLIKGPLP